MVDIVQRGEVAERAAMGNKPMPTQAAQQRHVTVKCTHLIRSGRQLDSEWLEHGASSPAEPRATRGRAAWWPMREGLGNYVGGVHDGVWVATEQKDVLEY